MDDWIYATQVKNYLLDDPLLDWLNLYYSNNRNHSSRKPKSYIFNSYLCRRGIDFENCVIRNLINKCGEENIKQISEHYQARDSRKFNETIQAMKDGVPIIYQGVLHNSTNKTFGVPDLLVRSDWVNKIIRTRLNIPQRGSRKLNTSFHYVVIDIKFNTLNLSRDGIHLLTSGYSKAYKGQLWIYNDALGLVQGYRPPRAYILGRGWKSNSKIEPNRSNNWFDKLGVIDYTTRDRIYIKRVNEALKWLRKVRREGHNWSISPPSIPQLYPNMCNQYDSPWRNIKEKIAKEVGEITSVWNCGIKERKRAHSATIYSWTDSNCTSDVLGFKKGKKKKIIDSILSVNRGTNIIHNAQIPIDDNVLFIDFEGVNNIGEEFNDSSITKDCGVVFHIGIGYVSDNKWEFKHFTSSHLSAPEERKIFNQFHSFVKERDYPTLIHWGNAEKRLFKKASSRYRNNWDIPDEKWFDLLLFFKRNSIAIKGCLNYSLKSIAKQMYRNKWINTTWRESDIKTVDGISAIVNAWKCDKSSRLKRIRMDKLPLMKEIIEYNEIDCKVLYEIIEYFNQPKDIDITS